MPKIIRYDFPDFKKQSIEMEELFRNLPIWADNATLNFSKDSFRRQGWIDERFERWQKRKGDRPGNTLIGKDSGALRRSLRLTVGNDYFEIHTNKKYAQIHNEGGTITQKPTRKQRKYFWAVYYKYKTMKPRRAAMFRNMALAKSNDHFIRSAVGATALNYKPVGCKSSF